MSIEEQLKELILSRYKSVLNFAKTINMPYSTLDSIFRRGLNNASVTNIIKVCSALGISADGLSRGEIVANVKDSSPMLFNRVIVATKDGTKREYTLTDDQINAILTVLDNLK